MILNSLDDFQTKILTIPGLALLRSLGLGFIRDNIVELEANHGRYASARDIGGGGNRTSNTPKPEVVHFF